MNQKKSVMYLIKLIKKWFFTSKPQKKMEAAVQLMFYFNRLGWSLIRRYFQRKIYYTHHCEVSHSAKISSSVTFVHPIMVIIGSNAVVQDNVKIYQGVTIGATNSDNLMPTIEKGCVIYAGAKILGGIVIGKNTIVGANSVVTKSIPANSKVVGINRILANKIELSI